MLLLSPLALQDLQTIRDYSVNQWGDQRARSFVVASHVVYYQILHTDVEIIRILHARQFAPNNLV